MAGRHLTVDIVLPRSCKYSSPVQQEPGMFLLSLYYFVITVLVYVLSDQPLPVPGARDPGLL